MKLSAKLSWFGSKKLTPFKKFAQNKSPNWWRAYNNVKHTWSKALKQANMDNALEALSGAFLLNTVHYPSIKHLWQLGILKTGLQTGSRFKESIMSTWIFDLILHSAIKNLKPLDHSTRIETQLFICENIVPGKPVPDMT